MRHNADEIPGECVLRISAGVAVALVAVYIHFGSLALLGIGLCLMATVVSGALICAAAMALLWIFLGKARLSRLINRIDSAGPFILPLIYLAASVASGVHFYKMI